MITGWMAVGRLVLEKTLEGEWEKEGQQLVGLLGEVQVYSEGLGRNIC